MAIKFIMTMVIPDTPGWIEEELAKKEYLRAQAIAVRITSVFCIHGGTNVVQQYDFFN